MNRRILTIITLLTAAVACRVNDEASYKFDNSVYLDVSAMKNRHTTNFSNNVPSLTREITVTLAYPSETDITATVAVDPALVDEFNGRYGTSYEMLPSRYYEFAEQNVTIPAGRTTSQVLPLNLVGLMGEGDDQTGALTMDNTYLLPVAITASDMTRLKGSDVAYYLVRRSSQITVAARLGKGNWISFPTLDEPGEKSDAFNGLTAVTYEALINLDEFLRESVNISSIMGVEQYLLLRIGDTNFNREQLQFDGSGGGSSFGKFPAADKSKLLETGRWTHVACTYDQTERTVRIYVDGKIQSETKGVGLTAPSEDNRINLAMRALGIKDAYQFFIGRSYDDERPLMGMICEARVWSVARTPEQIWENMYRISNPKEDPTLIGYWKFDEGKGKVIRDYSMYGNDGVAEKDIEWPSGIEIKEINKEEE